MRFINIYLEDMSESTNLDGSIDGRKSLEKEKKTHNKSTIIMCASAQTIVHVYCIFRLKRTIFVVVFFFFLSPTDVILATIWRSTIIIQL